MYKIISLVLASLLAGIFFASSINAQTNRPGDTNGDGNVDLTDLSTLLSNFGKKDSGVKSIVKATVYQHVGTADQVVYQAKVVVRDHATNTLLGQGLTDSNGKSPEWLINANTQVDVYAYSPDSYATKYCGDVWSVNTGPYGTTQAQNLRLKDTTTVPCILDQVCHWAN